MPTAIETLFSYISSLEKYNLKHVKNMIGTFQYIIPEK